MSASMTCKMIIYKVKRIPPITTVDLYLNIKKVRSKSKVPSLLSLRYLINVRKVFCK